MKRYKLAIKKTYKENSKNPFKSKKRLDRQTKVRSRVGV